MQWDFQRQSNDILLHLSLVFLLSFFSSFYLNISVSLTITYSSISPGHSHIQELKDKGLHLNIFRSLWAEVLKTIHFFSGLDFLVLIHTHTHTHFFNINFSYFHVIFLTLARAPELVFSMTILLPDCSTDRIVQGPLACLWIVSLPVEELMPVRKSKEVP